MYMENYYWKIFVNKSIYSDAMDTPEPVFLKVYGAKESISRNEFPSLRSLAGRYDNHIPSRFPTPIDCLKIPAQNYASF